MSDEEIKNDEKRIPMHDALEVARMIPTGNMHGGRVPINMVPAPDPQPKAPPTSDDKE